jgi:hypothetical protein
MESELTKIALVHLYSQGFTGESLTNFDIKLSTPSIIFEQEKIALLKEKVDLARQMMETNLFPSDHIYEKLFSFSEDKYNEYRDLVREDKKRIFRLSQLENEGNDPAVSGLSYGTPHDLASMYGRRSYEGGKIPTGYGEPNPEGRPRENMSIIGTQDDPLGGRDRLGVHGMKGGYPSDNDNVNENFKTQSVLLKNPDIKSIKFEKKLAIEREKTGILAGSMLDENNIKDLQD